MEYRLSDLIEKLIEIEKGAFKLYNEIQMNSEKQKNKTLSIIVESIKKEEAKHIKCYEELKEKIMDQEEKNEVIDFYLYDKVAKLFYEFKGKSITPQINEVQEVIKFAYEFEKNNIALLIDIQGRLIQKEEDVDKYTHKIIDMIIKEEEKHERMFRSLIIEK